MATIYELRAKLKICEEHYKLYKKKLTNEKGLQVLEICIISIYIYIYINYLKLLFKVND